MKQRGLVAAVFAAVLVTGVTVSVVAQPPVGPDGPRQGMRRGGPGDPMGGQGGIGLSGLRQLELSDTQKEQIKTITESHRDEMRQIAQRTREAQRGLDAAAAGTSVNEADIRAKSTALASALADGAIFRAKVNAEIVGVLTTEQQQKLTELRTEREQRRNAAPRRPRGAR